jgi:RNA-directed DNA polymerase
MIHKGAELSLLLSNIMLNEFDQWMEANYLSKKVRKDRWAWNFGILKRRPITDDSTLVVKGTKAHAEEMREAGRAFLEGKLKGIIYFTP